MRKASNLTKDITAENGTTATWTYGIRVKRQLDTTTSVPTGMNTAAKSGDLIGWIVIDKDPTGSAIYSPAANSMRLKVEVRGRQIIPSDPSARIYTASGIQVKPGKTLLPGLYIVSSKDDSVKLILR